MWNKKQENNDYWLSFTDILTSLFLLFVFLFMLLLFKNYYDYKELEKLLEEVKALREIAGKIEQDLMSLKEQFTEFNIEGPDIYGNLRIILGENLVKFPTDMYEIDSVPAKGKEILRAVGTQIKAAFDRNPKLFTITVEGYTDTQSTSSYNYLLSYRRAKNVMLYWWRYCDLDPDIYDITPAGFGELESKLKVKTGDEKDEPENRRIEVRITPKFSDLMLHLQTQKTEVK